MRAIVFLFATAMLAAADDPKSKDDDAVAKCVTALRAKDAKVRLKAAADLKEIGAAAGKKAGLQLCRTLTLDPSKEVRKAALEATETVLPDLYPDLSTIKMAKNSDEARVKAIEHIGSLGEKGTAAAPLIGDIYKSEVLKNTPNNQAGIKDLVDVLVKIKAKDPASIKALGDAAQQSPIGPTRRHSLDGLIKLSTDDKELKKHVMPIVKSRLTDPDREVLLFAISSVAAYGQDAKDALPTLRQLKAKSKDQGVKQAAESAINTIMAAQ